MHVPNHDPTPPQLEQWERDETLRTLMRIAQDASSMEEFDSQIAPQLRRLTSRQRDEIFTTWEKFLTNADDTK